MHIALVVLASAIALTTPPVSKPAPRTPSKPATSASTIPAVDTAKPRTSGATLGIKSPVPEAPATARSNTLNVDVPASEVLKEAKEAKEARAAKIAGKQKPQKTPEIRGENAPSSKTKSHKKHTPIRKKASK